MQTKTIVMTVLAIGVLGTGFVMFSKPAHAQTANPFSGLVEAIAQKFGLDKSQVQAVVNDFHKAKQQERQQNLEQREETRLSNLVSKGKITDAQKQAILAEIAKLKSEYSSDAMKNLTPAERQEQFKKEHDEITAWATQQGIDKAYVMPFSHMWGVRGATHRGAWENPSITPSVTPGV